MESEGPQRVFLDTNVLFSGLRNRESTTGRVITAAADGQFVLVVSATVLTELVRNLRLKAPEAALHLDSLFGEATIEVVPMPEAHQVDPWAARGLGTDSDVFAAALAAEVDIFCTGDRPLLARLADVTAPRILTPRQLLDALTANDP